MRRRRSIACAGFVLTAMLFSCTPELVAAQNSTSPTGGRLTPQDNIQPAQPKTANPSAQDPDAVVHEKGLNLLSLLQKGGWFMLPLGLLSLLVVAIGLERGIALRRDRMMPEALVKELGDMGREGSFDPRAAYHVCQQFPSAASRVIRSMLLKVGRPQLEVENAANEASQRDATKLQSVVSWLTLAAAVAPLIGLLGTVWGISQAFYDTTQLVAGQNKAEVLANGIYTALVTTMCGLIIAIPAAVLAHFFDNRILHWFHKIDELIASLTPQIEPFEGRLRASMNGFTAADEPVGANDDGAARSEQDLAPLPVAAPANRPR